jgi:hypothetical protein
MILKTSICWLASVLFLYSAESSDILRFSNGDQLHGSFQGFKEGGLAVWQRDDLTAAVEFKTEQIRHIVLQGGEPLKPLASLSHVALVNGDRVPGTLVSLGKEFLTIDTLFAGILKIPRNQVAMIAPSPLGGRVYYHGPFVEAGWKMAHASHPEGLPVVSPPVADEKKDQKPTPDSPGRWQFSGSAWYWPSKSSGTALLRENLMPDRSVLRFDLAWKSRLSIAIAFHADFQKTKAQEPVAAGNPNIQRKIQAFGPGDSSILPVLFGNSYIVQIFPTHLMLFRSSVDDDGVPRIERVQANSNPVRLGDAGKAQFEIRSNRPSGEISLFINDEFVVQWSEGDIGPNAPTNYIGKGAGIGFVVQNEESPVKISDIMVAEWNGMPDAARSLQVDDQDIVLLANGTDRFSGKVDAFQDGKVLLDGKYGSFKFELDDIAEIRFARNRLAKPTEMASEQLTIRLSPIGRISGRPIAGSRSAIQMVSSGCGEMNFQLESAVMLDFQKSNSIIDAWDPEF